LFDSYHYTKFIASGSAAAALKLKSNESGAGRFTDFILPPLTFHEYISLKGLDHLITQSTKILDDTESVSYKTIDIEELNGHFINYINFGGYPEVSLSEQIQANPGRYIRNDIIDKVLLRDLPSLYGIQDIQELNSLFTAIAYNSGNEFTFDDLSVTSGVSKNTIKRYISYLEAAFLIRVINRIDINAKKFKRANFFKIYLTNPSLRSALFSPISATDDFVGNMVETAIFSQWSHNSDFLPYYARWSKGEVDIVGLNNKQKPSWAVEIKWSNRYVKDLRMLSNLKSFCLKNDIKQTIVTTINIGTIKEDEKLHYDFIPASLYCYGVGKNLVQSKISEALLANEKD
jgi:predicted AAA+ superfamily ATPase